MAEMEDILVSVVIPVKNGEPWLEETLSGIFAQKLEGKLEVLIIDSGSGDRSLEIINRFPVRLIQVDSWAFNHGLTRNLGVQETHGKYVVMTVQDARPADSSWIQKMLDSFSSPDTAGVCGAQVVPHEADKNPAEWYRPVSAPQIRSFQFESEAAFESLSPHEKRQVCAWDNVTAMYRKDVLMQIPFRQTDFAEDALWARDALQAGYRIVYNPAARVYHYHHESEGYTYRRTLTVLYHFYHYFGWLSDPVSMDFSWHFRIIKSLLKAEKITWQGKYQWYRYNIDLTRAVNRAITDVRNALEAGSEQALKSLHDKYCADVPQAPKNILTHE